MFLLIIVAVSGNIATESSSCWDFSVNSSTQADPIGGKDATVTSATFNIGGYYTFDGNNDLMTLSLHELLSTEDFSFVIWLKTTVGQGSIIDNTEDRGDTYLSIDQYTDLKPRFNMEGNESTTSMSETTGDGVVSGKWTMVTAVFDKSGGNINLYLNSTINKTSAITVSGRLTSLDDWKFGARYYQDGTTGTDSFWEGDIHGIIFYGNKSLTQTDINNLVTLGPSFSCSDSGTTGANVSITSIVLTSPNPDQNITVSTITGNTTDTTPTLALRTLNNANCTINSTVCSSTGTTSHTCTVSVANAMSIGLGNVSWFCNNSIGNSSTATRQLNITTTAPANITVTRDVYMTNTSYTDRFDDYTYKLVNPAESTDGWSDALSSRTAVTTRIEGTKSLECGGTFDISWCGWFSFYNDDSINVTGYDTFAVWTYSNTTKTQEITVGFSDSTNLQTQVTSNYTWVKHIIDISTKSDLNITSVVIEPNIEDNDDVAVLIDHLQIYDSDNYFNTTNWAVTDGNYELQLVDNGFGVNSTQVVFFGNDSSYHNNVGMTDFVGVENYEAKFNMVQLQDLGVDNCRMVFDSNGYINLKSGGYLRYYIYNGTGYEFVIDTTIPALNNQTAFKFVRNSTLCSWYAAHELDDNWVLKYNASCPSDLILSRASSKNTVCAYDDFLMRELIPETVSEGTYTPGFIYKSDTNIAWNNLTIEWYLNSVLHESIYYASPTDYTDYSKAIAGTGSTWYADITYCDINGACVTNYTQDIIVGGTSPINLSINGTTTVSDLELGATINVRANSTSYITICLDINHSSFGVNYICQLEETLLNLKLTTFDWVTFNDSATATNLTYTTSESNQTVYFKLNQYDLVSSVEVDVTGFVSGSTYPTGLSIYVDDNLDQVIGDVFGNELTKLSDGSTTKNVSFTGAGTDSSLIFKINKGTTITDARLKFNGLNYTYRQLIPTTTGSSGSFKDAVTKAYDGDWSTYATTDVGVDSIIYFNYTKPTSVLPQSMWEVKDFDARTNITLDSGCFNQDPLQLRAELDSNDGAIYTDDFDTTSDFSSDWSYTGKWFHNTNGFAYHIGNVNDYLTLDKTFDLSSFSDGLVTAQLKVNPTTNDDDNYICMQWSCNGGTSWTGSKSDAYCILGIGNKGVWKTKSIDIDNVCGTLPDDFMVRFWGRPQGNVDAIQSVKDVIISGNPFFTNVTWGCYDGGAWVDEREVTIAGFDAGVYEEAMNWVAYPTDAWMEVGTIDGVRDWNYTANFTTTASISNDYSAAMNSYLSTCIFDENGFCSIPIYLASDSIGRLEMYDIDIGYDLDVNPIIINQTLINDYLDTSSGFVDVPIKFEATGAGIIQVDNVKVLYLGGNKTYAVTAHNLDYTVSVTQDIQYFYSGWLYDYPSKIDYFEVIPRRPDSVSVQPYGQTTSRPIFNITPTNYGGRTFNLSFYSLVGADNITTEASGKPTSSSGTWDTSYPVTNIYDDNWTTYATETLSATGSALLYLRYDKPDRVKNTSTWEVKDQAGRVNLTIPNICWDASNIYLYFSISSDNGGGPGDLVSWNCYNGSSYIQVRGQVVNEVYEEAMHWRIQDPSNCVNTSVNINSTKSTTPITYNAWNTLKPDIDYLNNTQLWFWLDFGCNYNTWNLWQPDYYFRACCDGCICSEDIII